MDKLILKPGREKSLKRHHPWIFSGAIAQVTGKAAPGDTLLIEDSTGKAWGFCAYSPASQLTGRIWTFNIAETVDEAFFRRRIRAAIAYRRMLGMPEKGGGARLIASEADGLPGLIVDVYDRWLIVQFLACGVEVHRETIADILQAEYPCDGIFERSDVDVRKRERLPLRTGVMRNAEPPELVTVSENGLSYHVDVKRGHKTGFYFDQRENRRVLQDYVRGKSVLNLFSYTGGFGVSAAAAGAAHVVNVDSSTPALKLCAMNMDANGIPPESYENIAGDVFQVLREFRAQERHFDVIILDPPKFVDSAAALARGCRAYKDIALQSFQLLNAEGCLFTFSCSGLMTPELFQKVTADAALDAGKEAAIRIRLGQAQDHPTPLAFPEAHYLKGLIVDLR